MKHALSLSSAIALSLSLLACQAPQQLSTVVPSTVQAESQPMAQAPQLEAQARYQPAQQRLDVKIQAQFGTKNTFQTQGFNCSAIQNLELAVIGLGFSDLAPDGGNPLAASVAGDCTQGSISATFSNVPVGKSRVLRIRALDAANNAIPGAEILAVFDLADAPVNIDVDQHSTPMAEVVAKLATEHGDVGRFLLSQLDYDTQIDGSFGQLMSVLTQAADAKGHPRLVNVNAIALALVNAVGNGGDLGDPNLTDVQALFVHDPVSLAGTLSAPNGSYTIRLRDPLSSDRPVTVVTGSSPYTLSGVVPGTWVVEVENTVTGVLEISQEVVVTGQAAQVLPLSVSAPANTTANWASLNGPEGGHIHSIVNNGSATMVGTDYGTFSSADLSSIAANPWQAQTGLEGKKVLSLMRTAGGSLYAGVNGLERFQQTGSPTPSIYLLSGNDWNPVSDPDTNNLNVYKLLEHGANLYGATSDGIIEKASGDWTKVNGNLSATPGARKATDIEALGSQLVITLPDHNLTSRIFTSNTPGDGWTPLGGAAPPGNPKALSVAQDGQNFFVGTENGTVFRFDPSTTWTQVGGSPTPNPGAPVVDLLSYINGSNPGLLAATNGLVNGGNSSAVQQIEDQQSTFTPPALNAGEPWNELGNPSKTVNNPYILSLAQAPGFNPANVSGTIAGTAGGGVNLASFAGTLDWSPVNAGLNASSVEEIASYESGGVLYLFVATKGGGVHRLNTQSGVWTPLLNMDVAVSVTGQERFPREIAVDSNGTAYAWSLDGLVMLPNAHLATADDTWLNFNGGVDPVGLSVQDLAVNGNHVYLAADQATGDVYRSCIFAAGPCSSGNWSDRDVGGPASTTEIFSLAPSPINSNTLLAGGEANLFLSSDAGTTWSDSSIIFSNAGLSAGDKVVSIAFQEAGLNKLAYLGVEGGGAEGLYRFSHTGIPSLSTNLAGSLPDSVLGVVLDETTPNRIFVAVEGQGIYLSEDAALGTPSFTPFNAGSVSPAAINLSAMSWTQFNGNPYLILGTEGRGLYQTSY